MKFTFNEQELVEFIHHVNSILYGNHQDLDAFRSPAYISKATGDAIKERIKSCTYDVK